MKALLCCAIASAACFAAPSIAQTIQTQGPGSAVTSVDRAADFNALAINGTPLSDYIEGAIFIGVDGDSWVGTNSPPLFDPFHGANAPDRAFYFPFGGSPGWTVIRTTDAKTIYAVEFMYGNGWTTGDIYGVPWGNHLAWVDWQTRRGNVVVSSGQIGVSPLLEMGTTVGFLDPSGFDELWVRCKIANAADPTLQALALDNLRIQITPPPAPCYANCDGNTTAPILTANDFQCFLNAFAAGDVYANCDGSTSTPLLTANDFQCFLNTFAAGCT